MSTRIYNTYRVSVGARLVGHSQQSITSRRYVKNFDLSLHAIDVFFFAFYVCVQYYCAPKERGY